jgi:hypothetical protein
MPAQVRCTPSRAAGGSSEGARSALQRDRYRVDSAVSGRSVVEACCLWQERLQDRRSLSIRNVGPKLRLKLEQFRQDPARDER